MIRPLTFLSLLAAAGAGLHLYGVKHEVSQLERTLRDTVKQTELARERTAVLRAEWALLNEPERLRAAATRNLALDVMLTTQFVRPADLERRLPAAVTFAGAPSLFGPGGGRAEQVAASPAADVPGGASGPAGAAPVAAAMMAAAAAAARVAQAAVTPAAQAASNAQVSVTPLPLPPRSTAVPPAAAAVQVASARPGPERMAAAPRTAPERVTVAPVPQPSAAPAPTTSAPATPAPTAVATLPRPPLHAAAPAPEAATRAPEVAARQPETRALEPRPIAAPARAPERPIDRPIGDRTNEIRMTARDVDRAMNLSAPPQPAPLLRTVHLRPAAPLPAPRAPEPSSALGSIFGGRTALAPPVPMAVASARAATLDRAR